MPILIPHQECLEDKIDESGFSADCKEELDNIIAKRVSDFKLDTPLREACEGDLQVGTKWLCGGRSLGWLFLTHHVILGHLVCCSSYNIVL